MPCDLLQVGYAQRRSTKQGLVDSHKNSVFPLESLSCQQSCHTNTCNFYFYCLCTASQLPFCSLSRGCAALVSELAHGSLVHRLLKPWWWGSLQWGTERRRQASLNRIYIIKVRGESELGKGVRCHSSGRAPAKEQSQEETVLLYPFLHGCLPRGFCGNFLCSIWYWSLSETDRIT